MRRAVVFLVLLALAGCDSSTSSYRPAPAPVGSVVEDGGAADVPAALLGSWSGDDASDRGSWAFTVSADGGYRMANQRRGITINGALSASGARLNLRPQGAAAYSVPYSISGGRLTLNGSVYLRTTASSRAAVVGTWLNLDNTYKTLTLTSDGHFRIVDEINGNVSGTYAVTGSQLTMRAQGWPDTAFGLQLNDGMLRLLRADGTTSEYVRS
jgi:hypothetical protein